MMLLDNHSSSSLEGMEIATRTSSPWTESSGKTASYHSAKPLPPTPTLHVPSAGSSRLSSTISSRRPSYASSRTHSTGSSIYTDDVSRAPKYVPFRKDTLLEPLWFPSESVIDRSSASEVLELLVPRSQLTRNAKSQPVLPKAAKVQSGPPRSIFTEWKAPRYRDSGEGDENEEIRAPVPVMVLARNSREAQHIAEQHAEEYMSVLPWASTMPRNDNELYHEGFNSLPTQMSPRITDVVDETLVPRPLRKSTALDSDKSSRFSSDPEFKVLKDEYGDLQNSQAKSPLHSRTPPEDEATTNLKDSYTASKSSTDEHRKKVLSMTPSERGSIQRGIIDMYDSLNTLYDPLKQHDTPTEYAPTPQTKSEIEIVPLDQNVRHKGIRSPAMPMTPYLVHRHKARDTVDFMPLSPLTMSAHESWFTASPTSTTPKMSHFSQTSHESSSKDSRFSLSSMEKKKLKSYTFPRAETRSKGDRSVSGKLKKAVGLDGKKSKMTDDERRREDLKKRIKVVEAIEQGPFLVERSLK